MAIAVGHVVVATAALGTGIVLVVAGTRSGAELETLYTPIGVAVCGVALVFGAVAVNVVRSTPHHPHRAAGLSRALGLLEVLAGLVCAVSAAVAVASYPQFTPWRSPALLPALVLVALGVTAVIQSSRVRRQE
ncbi:hypothetical protein ASH01_17775 [Terrabacter sp. Soil811]|uniref:hypothetical protein n=1 Tax=Terrabacter sp. Soil811 TaxID=1736419 RepID=UPI0006F84ED4|nr:hypothetical protein [Terrabacter sp. Soil811]KRF42656.1 hypothetical protein ASH01_17775 [Terrabacter sp. Soil811]